MANYKRYGLTEKEYKDMVKACGNTCMICGKPPVNRALNIDHNHKYGFKKEAVRGLLCWTCNRFLIGKMGDREDSVELFRKAADYLENYRKGMKTKKEKKLFKFSKK